MNALGLMGFIFGTAAAILAILCLGISGTAFARTRKLEEALNELRARMDRNPS